MVWTKRAYLWGPPPLRDTRAATLVVLWGGWPFFDRFWASLKTRKLNMFTLIGLGVGAAYGYSLVATISPELFPASCGRWAGMCPCISRLQRSSRPWCC